MISLVDLPIFSVLSRDLFTEHDNAIHQRGGNGE